MSDYKKIMSESYSNNKDAIELARKIETKYTKNLDQLIEDINNLIANDIDNAPSDKLEYYCTCIPSHLYYLTTGLEEIGVKMEFLNQEKKDKYNKIFIETIGTLQIKKATAELETANYAFAYIVYKQAYDCLKEKMDAASKLYDALKKVLTKRISERDLSKKDPYMR